MGIFDVITGRSKLKGPAPDRLFALSTAYVTLESEHEIRSTGVAAIVFQPLATSDFEQILKETEAVVKATGSEVGTSVETRDDDYGYRWVVLRAAAQADDGSTENLVVGVNAVSSALESAGYGERLLAAVFAFKDSRSQPIYFIYNYKRGFWYPFVPAPGDQQRSTERELQLKAQIGNELPVEPELERWFPLWGIPI
jgi:hypothetical protein